MIPDRQWPPEADDTRALLMILTLFGYVVVFLVGLYVGGWRPW